MNTSSFKAVACIFFVVLFFRTTPVRAQVTKELKMVNATITPQGELVITASETSAHFMERTSIRAYRLS